MPVMCAIKQGTSNHQGEGARRGRGAARRPPPRPFSVRATDVYMPLVRAGGVNRTLVT
jgi:hypothetical protein